MGRKIARKDLGVLSGKEEGVPFGFYRKQICRKIIIEQFVDKSK